MTAQTSIPVERPATDIGAPDWLRERQDRAWAQLLAHGLPTTRHEDWRYTDLQPVAALIAAPQSTGGSVAALTPVALDGCCTLMVVDGQFRPEISTPPRDPAVRFSARSTTGAPGEVADSATGGGGDAEAPGVAALKSALLRDEITLDIDGSVSAPLYVVFGTSPGSRAHTAVRIRLSRDSAATVIEHHLGDGPALSTTTTQIDCERGARLRYVKLQNYGDVHHLGGQQIHLQADASADLLHLDLGARLARNDLQVTLAGPGAEVSAQGLFFADGERHLDHHTRIDHRAPRTRSRETYRGIMDQHGHGVFNGKIVVHPGADGTDAQLRNQNLLLSAGAEIDTKPELEIYADDVKCSHGATTGQLDRNAIFYLRSRGLSADQARRLLIASFAREIVMHLPDGPLEEHVTRLLATRLPELAAVGARP